jgi:PST family polysaccharide transporter
MVGYGIGASTFSFLDQLVAQIDTAVVGRVLGRRALGLYTVAFRIPTLVLENIASQISLVAFPALARKRVADAGGVGGATARLVRYEALYALPLAAGMAVMAKPIVDTVFSRRWQDAAGVFAAVSVMSGISAAGFALGDGLKALGRQRLLVILTVIQFPVLLVTIILVAPYGITAVAWARVGGTLLWVGLVTVSVARVTGMSIPGLLGAAWPGAVASAGVVATAGPVRLWAGLPAVPELVLAVVAGGAGTLIALAVLAPPTFHELRHGALGVGRRLRSRATGAGVITAKP